MKLLKNTPEFEPEEVVVAEELLDSYLASPADSGYYVLVAEFDSIVGYVCYGPVPLTKGSWDIYWMAVDREEQNKGIGKKLIQSAEEGIRKQQGRLSFIETSSQPSYEKTRRFHIAQGYQQICRVADFYSPGDDKIIYQKRLS